MTAPDTPGGLQAELAAFGANPNVISLVLAAAAQVPAQTAPTVAADYKRVVGADGAQTSLYVHKGFVSIALPPDVSGHYAALTGGSVQKKKATHYLLARSAQLSSPDARGSLVDAAAASLEHYRDIPGHGPHGNQPDGPAHEPYEPACPDCFMRLSKDGNCNCYGH